MRALLLILMVAAAWVGNAMATPALPELRLLVDNPRPYVGETVTLSLEFGYDRLPNTPLSTAWTGLDNLIVTDLPALLPRREPLRGTRRIIETVRKQAHALTARPSTMRVALSGDGIAIASAPLTIHPRPLPQRDRPNDFSGAVVHAAQLSLRAPGSGTREVIVTLAGEGNLSAVELRPHLRRDDRLTLLGDELLGWTGERQTRQWRYLYQPQTADHRPDFSLSVFDPDNAKYRTLRTAAAQNVRLNLIAACGGGLLLLLGLAIGLRCARTRRRGDLDHLLTELLGEAPHAMTHARFAATLQTQQLSPELIAALLRERRRGEQRFAPGAPRQPEALPLSRSKLAQRLAMEIDKAARLP